MLLRMAPSDYWALTSSERDAIIAMHNRVNRKH